MELSKSIILIGMPGCGKSTVGKILAKKYKARFVDTDNLIKTRIGTKLQDYIDTYGRDEFLNEEHRTIMELSPEEPWIIATGGSVVLNEESMKHFKEIGTNYQKEILLFSGNTLKCFIEPILQKPYC